MGKLARNGSIQSQHYVLHKQNLYSDRMIKRARRSCSEMFLVKGVLKINSKFTGDHLCRSVIWIKLLCNFIEISLRHGFSPVNLLHIFSTPFTKNTSGWLFLESWIGFSFTFFWKASFNAPCNYFWDPRTFVIIKNPKLPSVMLT